MGNVTLSLEKEDEEKLRKLAQEKYNGRKGALSRVVSEGLSRLELEPKKERARMELISLMKKGIDMGRITIKHRSELYER